jgi:hypothetical protein
LLIRAIFGNSIKAKTLLIVRLQGFIYFDSLFCDPAGIGSAPQTPNPTLSLLQIEPRLVLLSNPNEHKTKNLTEM